MDITEFRSSTIGEEGWRNQRYDAPGDDADNEVIGVGHSTDEDVSETAYGMATDDPDYDDGPALLPDNVNNVDNPTVNQIFNDDIETAVEDSLAFLGSESLWNDLTDIRREVIAQMAFQMGRPHLNGFTQFLQALNEGNWGRAADEMLDSTWATQTPRRAHRMADGMRNNSRETWRRGNDPYANGP